MNINRNNYEEFFLLYIDNELSSEERRAVEAFIETNPDLKSELESFQAVTLTEENISIDKSLLFKSDNPVTSSNYENYFVLYGDDELSLQDKEYTEEFVYKNPQYQQDFELIIKARLTPDLNDVFPDKEKLFRKEKSESRPVFYLKMTRYAAAAAIVGIASIIIWKSLDTNKPDTNIYAGNNSVVESPIVTNNGEENKEELADLPVYAETDNQKNELQNVEQYAKVNYSEKKSSDGSNISNVVNVQPIESGVKTERENMPEKRELNNMLIANLNQKIATDQMIGEIEQPELINNQNIFASGPAIQENKIEYAAIELPNDKNKNEFRGIFRKATRIFERVANKESESSSYEKTLNIASFEIALK